MQKCPPPPANLGINQEDVLVKVSEEEGDQDPLLRVGEEDNLNQVEGEENFEEIFKRMQELRDKEAKEKEAMEAKVKELLEKAEKDKEEAKVKRRELAAKQRQETWLETAFYFKVAGIGKQKMCSLDIRGGDHHTRGRIPIVINDHDNFRMFRDLCDKTVWSKSKNKEYKDNGYEDGMWIRGEHEAVRKTIWWNWEDISAFRWTKTNVKPHLEVSQDINELRNDTCEIKRKDNWTEIKCFNKEVKSQSKFPPFHLPRKSRYSLASKY